MKKILLAMVAIALVVGVNADAKSKKGIPARDISSVKGFKCGGTEPFFSVNITGKNVEFELVGEKKASFKTKGAIGANGFSSGHVMSYQSTNFKNVVTILSSEIAGGKCSDGMSDQEYAYHMVFVTPTGTFAGCCNAE